MELVATKPDLLEMNKVLLYEYLLNHNLHIN